LFLIDFMCGDKRLLLFVKVAAIAVMALSCQAIFAKEYLAEVVWVVKGEEGEQNHIYFSGFNGEEWELHESPIYSSANSLTTPTIGTSQSGKKILIWSEQRRLKSVLMTKQAVYHHSQTSSDVDLLWSEATVFADIGLENLGPSIVFDFNDDAWVFWAASRNKPSDVYFVKSTVLGWADPKRVHAANQVPDNQPIVTVTELGNVHVEWQTFDLITGNYIVDSREYLIETLPAMKESQVSEKQLTQNDINYPGFLASNNRVVLHFPKNKFNQSVVLQ